MFFLKPLTFFLACVLLFSGCANPRPNPRHYLMVQTPSEDQSLVHQGHDMESG